jgi:para-aminobenzoate synthetase component I
LASVGQTSRSLAIDLSAERLANVVGGLANPAILEGGPEFGVSGRWSLYTALPRLVFEATEASWRLERDGRTIRVGHLDPLAALADLIDEFDLARSAETPDPDPDAPPFQGGLIGFLGYDLAPRLERLPRRAQIDSRIPVIRFGLYDWAATFDHFTGRAELSAHDLLGDEPLGPRLRHLRKVLMRRPVSSTVSRLSHAPRSQWTKAEYLSGVAQCLEYIAAGDIFQVNLSQRFSAKGNFDPLDLYTRLRRRSPAPFSALLRWDDLAVVSASPEWFYQTRGETIVTRPIKGTRPRGATPEQDARLEAELVASAKDRAELTMIVDLERNDLGRVCEFGTVRVVEPLVVESFASVHHLVATVEGRLRPDVSAVDVVRAVFPGGSITGAPKIRAMEIIDELEPTRRNLYTGAIGYFGRGGSSAFNIAIRTMLVEGDRLTYQVGGGIVADSGPNAEFEETLHKGRALREVLDGWGA